MNFSYYHLTQRDIFLDNKINLFQKMRRIFSHYLVFVLILSIGSAMNLFNFTPLPKTNGAMCMDGSQYGIYTYAPDDDSASKKMFIYF